MFRRRGSFHVGDVRLGRIAGVEVRLHWTWGIAASVIALALAGGVFPAEVPGLSGHAYYGMGVATALLFFVSLLLHELGHALAARREGIPTETITLWMLGGVAQSATPFRSPGVEARVALAGPAVSAILAIGLVAGGHVVGLPASIAAVLEWLGWTNVLLLAFNMLPALPLDGGRVLRAALWRIRRSQLRATRDAARVSQVLATGMISLGGARLRLRQRVRRTLAYIRRPIRTVGRQRRGCAHADPGCARRRQGSGRHDGGPDHDRGEIQRSTAHRARARQRPHAYPVVDEHGDAIGLVSVLSAEQVPERRRAWVTVRKLLAEAGEPLAFDAEAEILAAVPGLATNPLQHAVVLRAGRLVGVVSLADVTRVARTRGADDLPPATPEEFARAGSRRPAGAAP